ncbi:cytochrome o ubiquinol oxidase subunit IV [Sphingomonas nostoxanthinifaciens]|uniref:cytochrome o ubiquinol oxidase subunit IV n=1 Tax=Sphingomonas nostoxanthinifaciens TaxID=2872652 RepID=UPI001CC209D1|nr:cytochrome o ubiquinol oxidase subunit IV [Sphingomonas nostoxanthinifaciens]UAK22879.1 cytochrome o ubiquinol oxidase subunit IV [Sphingomonas nostoxanthinifaciens]
MSHGHHDEYDVDDAAPGDEVASGTDSHGIRVYAIGLFLATLLTIGSFWVAGSSMVWGPGIPSALIALAVAQIGVHLVFFLHITSGPENTNNTIALAFGFTIVLLVVVGSIWIMHHLDHNMMPMSQMMQMQR